jgi:hypothetical protein
MEILRAFTWDDDTMTVDLLRLMELKENEKIILDLLDYSRAGKSLMKESVDLNEVMIDYKALRKT